MRTTLALRRPAPADILAAAVAAVALGVPSAVIGAVSLPPVPATVLLCALAVLVAAVPWRRAAPRAAFVVVCVAVLGQAVATGLFLVLPTVLVLPVMIYSCCGYGGRHAPLLAAVGSGVCAPLAVARFATDPSVVGLGFGPPPLLLLGLLLAVSASAWGLGSYRRVRLAADAAERDQRALQAVREERARIAREMHDVVAHSLAVVVVQARGGRYVARTDPEGAERVLATIEDTSRRAMADLRAMLAVLRTDPSDGASPQPGLVDVEALISSVRSAGLAVDHRVEGRPGSLSPAGELAVYRVLQESLTNVVKHAGAGATATVTLRWRPDELTVEVRDDGAAAPAPGGGGHGLAGMRERVAALGGTLSAAAAPGGGFTVVASLPVGGERR